MTRLSRRAFLAQSGAIGLSSGLAAGRPSRALGAAGPKRGGFMRLAMGHGSTTDTFDPATIVNGFQWVLTHGIVNTLVELSADGRLGPSLAEEWDRSADAARWSFKLRKGVEFHNGRSLSVRDVIASINYHRAVESKSSVKPLVAPIESVTADGSQRIVIALKSGNIDFPYILNEAPLAIWPAADNGGIDWASGIGSGGYVLKRYEPGRRAQFERNPNYWKEDRAHADQVELITIADAASRSNAIVTGDVHAIDQVDLKTAALLAKEPGVIIEKTHGPLHYNFVMKTHMAPFDGLHVRRALKFSVDREELLQKILFGHGSIGNDHPIGPFYRYYAADIEQTGYDPDRAKWHLRQAGLDRLAVTFHAADAAFAGAVDTGILFSEQAARAGITIKVVREPDDGYWPNVWAKRSFCAEYWGGYSTEDAMFSMGYSPGAPWNGSRWQNEAFLKLLNQARTEFDEARRHEIYRDMQAIMRDDGGTIVPLFAHAVVARSSAVAHDEQVSPVRPFDGRRIIERWWVA